MAEFYAYNGLSPITIAAIENLHVAPNSALDRLTIIYDLNINEVICGVIAKRTHMDVRAYMGGIRRSAYVNELTTETAAETRSSLQSLIDAIDDGSHSENPIVDRLVQRVMYKLFSIIPLFNPGKDYFTHTVATMTAFEVNRIAGDWEKLGYTDHFTKPVLRTHKTLHGYETKPFVPPNDLLGVIKRIAKSRQIKKSLDKDSYDSHPMHTEKRQPIDAPMAALLERFYDSIRGGKLAPLIEAHRMLLWHDDTRIDELTLMLIVHASGAEIVAWCGAHPDRYAGMCEPLRGFTDARKALESLDAALTQPDELYALIKRLKALRDSALAKAWDDFIGGLLRSIYADNAPNTTLKSQSLLAREQACRREMNKVNACLYEFLKSSML